uniref:Sushi domain-containing protein n=1 Tax=Trichuris muris TaxID=70415 RepID=A0A5S6QZU8_TRIMR
MARLVFCLAILRAIQCDLTNETLDSSESGAHPKDFANCDKAQVPNASLKVVLPEGYFSYTCDKDFFDAGNGFVRCVSGRWVPPTNELCLRTCEDFGPPNAVILVVSSPSSKLPGSRDGVFVSGTRLRVICKIEGIQKRLFYSVECTADGRWQVTREDNGLSIFVDPSLLETLCTRDENDHWNRVDNADKCLPFDFHGPFSIVYLRAQAGPIQPGDRARISCLQYGHVLSPNQQSLRTCQSNGFWTDMSVPICVADGCDPPPVLDQLKPVYENVDTANGWVSRRKSLYTANGGIAAGVRLFFECKDPLHFYLVGERVYSCLASGQWSVAEWPECKLKRSCEKPGLPVNGFYNYNPNVVKFSPGHVLTFGCAEGYHLDGSMHLKCLDNGVWTSPIPSCHLVEWSNKRFIAVMSIVSILGMLLLALISLVFLKHMLVRKFSASNRMQPLSAVRSSDAHLSLVNGAASHGMFGGGPSPCMYSSDMDRLALIRFADDLQPHLPSYDEAISRMVAQRRSRPCFDSLSTLSGYCTRALRRLPSLSSLRSREQRNSSNSSVSNGAVGSADTVTISDTSTAVTLDTVGTAYSNTSSNRPQAGSLCSVTSTPFSGSSVTGVSVPLSDGMPNTEFCQSQPRPLCVDQSVDSASKVGEV